MFIKKGEKFMLKIGATFILIFFTIVHADTLVLKNGLKLQGTYKGGTEEKIKFETSGAVQELAVSEIESLSFSREAATAVAEPAEAAAVATPGAAASEKTIPAGTRMMIKTLDQISTANNAANPATTMLFRNQRHEGLLPKSSRCQLSSVGSAGQNSGGTAMALV